MLSTSHGFPCFSVYSSASEDLVAKGTLKGDEIARALVPNLLRKADRQLRGKTARTGSQSNCELGLLKLGFSLGGLLNNKHIQKAFGISRQSGVRPQSLRSDFLPFFFGARGSDLEQAARQALSMLNMDGCNEFMVVRDETAYARSYDLVYGLGDLCCIGGGKRWDDVG